jgi:TatD DNase family protein
MHDAHCHIDLYRDFQGVLAAIDKARVKTIAVTNTPSVFEMCERICAGNRFVYPALGLHPELAHQRERELPLMLGLLERVKFVGEVGLDFTTRDVTIRSVQVRVFEAVLAAARADGRKVLSIHSRQAAAEVVDLVGAQFPGTVILHWFSGSERTLIRAIENGYYFSVNVAMTNSARGRSVIPTVPRDRILTESDGPFVTVRDAPTYPTDVGLVVNYLAKVWLLPAGEVEHHLDTNFTTALSI